MAHRGAQAQGQEVSFEVLSRRIAGRRWHQGARYPTLALHGWRDNCASFDFLAPQLIDHDLLAVDMPGHAHSDFRSPDASYNIWEDIGELLAVCDQLGWDSFDLTGHSRGALVAVLLAASHPQRVRRLILIDGLFPQPVRLDAAPSQLAQAIADNKRLACRPPRYYESFDAAMAQRCKGPLGVSETAARALAERGVVEDDNGWYWRLDPRLGGASDVKFSHEHGEAFIRALACPVLLVAGESSDFRNQPHSRQLAALNEHIEMRVVPGGHHCHMEMGVEDIASLVRRFSQIV